MDSLDFSKLTDLGGVFIIALLLVKIIWNDLKHLNASADRMEHSLGRIEKHAEDSNRHLESIAKAHDKSP